MRKSTSQRPPCGTEYRFPVHPHSFNSLRSSGSLTLSKHSAVKCSHSDWKTASSYTLLRWLPELLGAFAVRKSNISPACLVSCSVVCGDMPASEGRKDLKDLPLKWFTCPSGPCTPCMPCMPCITCMVEKSGVCIAQSLVIKIESGFFEIVPFLLLPLAHPHHHQTTTIQEDNLTAEGAKIGVCSHDCSLRSHALLSLTVVLNLTAQK